MSNLIKEDDLDSFLDSYLKSLILPKIIGLSGPLGAGKTTIAKKIIKFFGCNDVVTSPTFNIVKNYEVGEIKIFHVDLYRLGSCLLYTSPSPRDYAASRMPSSA